MIKYSPPVSSDINNVTGINAFVKTLSVKITTITSNVKAIEGSNSYLKNIAKCSTLLYENIPLSVLLRDETWNNTYVSRGAQASCQLVSSFFCANTFTPSPFELVTRSIIAIWLKLSMYGWFLIKIYIWKSTECPQIYRYWCFQIPTGTTW